jgi:type IV pilus assembly protein PilN
MIRINLVAGERRDAKPAGGALQLAQKVMLAGSLMLIVTALLVSWRYWSTSQTEAQVASDIDAARREEVRLAEVLKQVGDFEKQRAQLQQRVTLIDELRRGQTAPVHIVDQISRSLPDLTWLISLKQDGYDLTIEGHCTSLTALSDFVGNLESTRYFKRPVEIVMSEVVNGQNSAPDLIRFMIKGTFQMAGIEPGPGARPPAPAPRGSGG